MSDSESSSSGESCGSGGEATRKDPVNDGWSTESGSASSDEAAGVNNIDQESAGKGDDEESEGNSHQEVKSDIDDADKAAEVPQKEEAEKAKAERKEKRKVRVKRRSATSDLSSASNADSPARERKHRHRHHHRKHHHKRRASTLVSDSELEAEAEKTEKAEEAETSSSTRKQTSVNFDDRDKDKGSEASSSTPGSPSESRLAKKKERKEGFGKGTLRRTASRLRSASPTIIGSATKDANSHSVTDESVSAEAVADAEQDSASMDLSTAPPMSEEDAAKIVHRTIVRWTCVKADRTRFIANRKLHRRRTQAARELLETEQSYVESLNIMVRCYLGPFRDSPEDVVSKSEVKSIFSDIEVILNLNTKLCKDLKSVVGDGKWTPFSPLGPLFLSFSGFFMLYSNYVNNYNSALTTLRSITSNVDSKRRAKFAMLVKECRLASESLLDLESFLIMPVQRIPRYKMLISEIVKSTHEDHPDFADLKKALDSISGVATAINTKIKDLQTSTRVGEVEKLLVGLPEGRKIQKTGRVLVEERSLRIHSDKSAKKGKKGLGYEQIFVFVFNDIILWTRTIGNAGDTQRYQFVRQDYRADLAASDCPALTIKATADVVTYSTSKLKVGTATEVPALSIMSLTNSALTLSFDTERDRDNFRDILNTAPEEATILVNGSKASAVAITRQRSWDELESSVQLQQTTRMVKRVQEDVARSSLHSSPSDDSTAKGHRRRKSVASATIDEPLDVLRLDNKKGARSKFRSLTLRAHSKRQIYKTKNQSTWWKEWDEVRLSSQMRQWKTDNPNKPLPPLPTPEVLQAARGNMVPVEGSRAPSVAPAVQRSARTVSAAPQRVLPKAHPGAALPGQPKRGSDGARGSVLPFGRTGTAPAKRATPPPPKRAIPPAPKRAIPPAPKRAIPPAPKRDAPASARAEPSSSVRGPPPVVPRPLSDAPDVTDEDVQERPKGSGPAPTVPPRARPEVAGVEHSSAEPNSAPATPGRPAPPLPKRTTVGLPARARCPPPARGLLPGRKPPPARRASSS